MSPLISERALVRLTVRAALVGGLEHQPGVGTRVELRPPAAASIAHAAVAAG